MIIKQKEDHYQQVGHTIESAEMLIDEQGLEFVFKAFSDTLYSDKIGSIVREITTNAYDSHQEAGVDEPVMIHLKEPRYGESDSGQIIFEDVGTGISPDRMNNIFRKYFSSTKRETNNEIGGFGIGSKTPLSYVKAFTLITRFEGVEYTYIINRGDKTPIVDLVGKQSTDERNGTQVVINISSYPDYDRFKKAIRTQLKFFDNVIINHNNFTEFNKQKIIKGKHFVVREGDTESNSGICLGKVHYPLNFGLVGLYHYNYHTPIALYFNVGEIDVTLNREQIDYNTETIAKIKEKIELVQKELSILYKQQDIQYDDLLEYIKARDNESVLTIDGVSFGTMGYAEMQDEVVYTPLKDYKGQIPRNLLQEFHLAHKVEYKAIPMKHFGKPLYQMLEEYPDSIYRLSGNLSKRKTYYLSDKHGKFYTLKYAPYDGIYTNAFPLDMPDKEQKKQIEYFRKAILRYVIKTTPSYDKTEIPESWLEEYKKNLKDKTKDLNRVKNLIFHIPQNDTLRHNVFSKTQIESFIKHKGKQIIYGGQEDEFTIFKLFNTLAGANYALRSVYVTSNDYKNAKFIVCKLSQENIKFLKNIEGFIHINDFIKQNGKLIYKLYLKSLCATAYMYLPHDLKYGYSNPLSEESREKINIIKSFDTLVTIDWIEKLIKENDWHFYVKHKGFYLNDLHTWMDDLTERLTPLLYINYRRLAENKSSEEAVKFAHRFLKFDNLKNYYYVQKNLCRP